MTTLKNRRKRKKAKPLTYKCMTAHFVAWHMFYNKGWGSKTSFTGNNKG
jgi:hypothetical protein